MYSIKHLLPRIKSIADMINSDHDLTIQRYILEELNDVALELSYLVEKGIEEEDFNSDSEFEPLNENINKYNAGEKCDMKNGPCSCGSWHKGV